MIIKDLKKLSNEELEQVIKEIKQIQKKSFFENFKLQVNKCYVSQFDLVIIKVKSIDFIDINFSESIKIVCEYYSTFGTKELFYEDNSVIWFHKDNIAQFSQDEFKEISEEKYNKIVEQLKLIEEQKKELKIKQNKIIESALNDEK